MDTRTQANSIPSIPMFTNRTIASRTNDMDAFNDDDFLCDIDIDQITSNATSQTETHTEHNTTNNRTVNRESPKSTLLFDDDMDDDEFLLQIDSPQPNRSSTAHGQMSVTSPTIVYSIYDEDYPFKIRGINLATLKQLNDCAACDRFRRKHFLVKAEIDNVTGRARVLRNQWKLRAILIDIPTKDGKMEVQFDSDVLERLANISAREICQMHSLCNTQPQIADEIERILEQLSTRLENLNSFLKIEFNADAQYPVIIEIINSAPVLERKFMEKLTSEHLLR